MKKSIQVLGVQNLNSSPKLLFELLNGEADALFGTLPEGVLSAMFNVQDNWAAPSGHQTFEPGHSGLLVALRPLLPLLLLVALLLPPNPRLGFGPPLGGEQLPEHRDGRVGQAGVVLYPVVHHLLNGWGRPGGTPRAERMRGPNNVLLTPGGGVASAK